MMLRVIVLVCALHAAVYAERPQTIADTLWMWGTPSGFKQLWAKYLSSPVGSQRTRITALESAVYVGVPNLFFFWEDTHAQCASSQNTQCDVINGSLPANDSMARRSSAEHLIATKALRCTATAWILIATQCSAIP